MLYESRQTFFIPAAGPWERLLLCVVRDGETGEIKQVEIDRAIRMTESQALELAECIRVALGVSDPSAK